MATETKLPVTRKSTAPGSVGEVWRPFEALRMEIDSLFDDFVNGFWRQPSAR
jgi:HSP20 family protein